MISTRTYPKTKSELIQAIQKLHLDKFTIVEPFEDKKTLDNILRDYQRNKGDVCVIVLRSK
jgi:hypothetical protein